MSFLKNRILLLLLFLCAINGYAQLSDLHYLPPLKQGGNNQAIREQAVYLSTPETTAFTVNVYQGAIAAPIATLSLSNATPVTYTLANGNNDITLVSDANTGVVLSSSGLHFEAPGGEKFYVNYRGSSGSQSTSLTSKGRQAMGTLFKWGGIPNRGTHASLTNTLGIMATEDNTTVQLYGYDQNCEFRLGNDRDGITNDTYTINLDANESFVFEAYVAETTANIDGWIGATVESDKNIVISNGGLNIAVRSGNASRDAAIDQPVPQNKIGKEYVFIRGQGTSETEKPIIIGTQNNTEIYVNGATTPIATINNGDYFEIPDSYYSSTSAGGNMFVTTTKDAYAYQSLAGGSSIVTVGLNFVAPVNCLLPDTVDNIPNIQDAAGITMTGGVTIVASTSTPDANISITDDNGAVTLPSSTPVAGSTDWKTYYVANLTGNVSVESTGPIAVGFIGYSGARGIAGYFSGFDTVPEVDLQVQGGGCLPGSVIEVVDANYDAYQWYQNGTLVPGAIFSSYTPTEAGDYYARVTKGGCTYDSQPIAAYYCLPDIVVKKTADKNTILEGDIVEFTITVESLGDDDVTNLKITDVIPNGLTLLSANPSVGSWSAPEWTIGTLSQGELVSLVLEVQADELPFDSTVSSYTNTVSNSQDQTDANITSDDLSETLTISNNEITVTKVALPAPDGSYDSLGEEITYELVVTNNGPSTLTNVTITDPMADSGSISPASVASLAPSNSVTFTLTHSITNSELSALEVTNTATAQALLPNGFSISDTSDDPNNSSDVDSNGDGEPDDPTVITLGRPKTVITNRNITYRVKLN
ncbi:DUF11 domain-containing protein [Maribacter thermophilus]|uniref:DUF11 domain-containing protein n=1 Tax=Maribacter thermophilus TaxID=1197874 RepID=UPI000B073E3D|nr:DUF11 domain-containing protein [Maribacter thermophilus]